MTAEVWPYHRADCPECGWCGPAHLSLVAAQDDADTHNVQHARATAILEEVMAEFGVE